MPSLQLEPLHMPPAAFPPLAAAPLPQGQQADQSGAQPLLDTLTRLGASDFHLTAWGSEGAWQRFECAVPEAGSAGFVRHFDAIEATPQQAIAQVVRDVVQWRSQQGAPSVASVH